MKTPILFLIYNRPDHTKRVFEAIRKVQPTKLFVAADGSKSDKAGDYEACKATREIATAIDWPCEIHTLFRDNNLGLKKSIPDAIDWFFNFVEEGIILEDDCLPSTGFFSYCEYLLEKYRNNDQIAHINGSNFLLGKFKNMPSSYFFSNIYHPWGWATWKRSWSLFDGEMKNLDLFIAKDELKHVTDKTSWRDTYYGLLTRTKRNEIDTWDYAWYYSLWSQHKYCITPTVNLVSNIGFGSDATHTNYNYSRLSAMKAHNIHLIKDPVKLTVNRIADEFALSVKFNEGKGNFLDKVKDKIRLLIKK
ncbi:MAG: hypothetical protein RLZ10_305 [Bacteroidota bacterium]|jgi:hypothetical protein